MPRGKPHTRLMDIVTRDLQQLGLSLAEAVSIALDRPKWRGLVALIGKTPPLMLSRRPDDDDDEITLLYITVVSLNGFLKTMQSIEVYVFFYIV